MKTNENGLGVKAFLSCGLKAFVWLFYTPTRTSWVANNVKHYYYGMMLVSSEP